MRQPWCRVCCTSHAPAATCPGELQSTAPERHAWRANVETSRGIEAYGVLVAPAGDVWRARILTYPNVLWVVPGGTGTLKFVARTPQEAERQAIEFIRRHCSGCGWTFRSDEVRRQPGSFDGEAGVAPPGSPALRPALRKIRFLSVRFGLVGATDPGGTGNLSETGMFVITTMPVDPGVRLRLSLDLGAAPLGLAGDVMWNCQGPHVGRSPGMGVRLVRPPARYLGFVRALS